MEAGLHTFLISIPGGQLNQVETRMGGYQRLSGCSHNEKNLCLRRNRAKILQSHVPYPCHYTDWATPAHHTENILHLTDFQSQDYMRLVFKLTLLFDLGIRIHSRSKNGSALILHIRSHFIWHLLTPFTAILHLFSAQNAISGCGSRCIVCFDIGIYSRTQL